MVILDYGNFSQNSNYVRTFKTFDTLSRKFCENQSKSINFIFYLYLLIDLI
jgi:hypothetical protein